MGIWALVGLTVALSSTAASASRIVVEPGQSIQAAVDAASPGDTVVVKPGDYIETHGNSAAVRITKSLKLIARSRKEKVRILPGPGNTDGIVVEPENPGVDPDVVGVKIKGFTVEGFSNNGIWLRHVQNFRIQNNESIDNLENGIWPTLSAKGLVKRNVSYGSLDAALWVEASEDVRVIKNDLHHSPTGLEITISKNILAKGNDVHHNTVGVGLYHPDAAGLPALGGDGDWDIVRNYIHDNNETNSAPPGSLSADLPPGGGILLLAVDRVNIKKNVIERNDFFGIAAVDWCLAFDCDTNPPSNGDSRCEDNTFVRNKFANNASSPTPYGGLETFAADITYLVFGGASANNCFARNDYSTILGFPGYTLANNCS
jgi:hypothetical protein